MADWRNIEQEVLDFLRQRGEQPHQIETAWAEGDWVVSAAVLNVSALARHLAEQQE